MVKTSNLYPKQQTGYESIYANLPMKECKQCSFDSFKHFLLNGFLNVKISRSKLRYNIFCVF